jgi:uncharacterized membrane protein (DUF485 family)
MKAFLIGSVLAVLLAVASGFILEGYFARRAEQEFSAPSARVEEPMGSGEVKELPTGER